jgi:hypothetical protein
MSESISGIDSNVGVEGSPSVSSEDGFTKLGAELEAEGFMSDQTSDDSGSDEYDPDHPEGMPVKDTLKVNGKNIERTYAEIKAAAQQYEATSMKLEQAKKEIAAARDLQGQVAGQQQAIKNIVDVIQRGDLEAIGEFARDHLNAGETFQKAVVQYALKLYEYSKMTPAQREDVENRKLVQKYRQEAEQRQQQDQQRAFEYKVNQWSEHLNSEIPKAITAVGLPDSDFVREHIIATWRAAVERGQNPTATAVANYVKERLNAAKLSGQPAPAPQTQARRKATRESVGLKNGRNEQNGQYMSWTDWQKTRGK